MGFPTDNGGFRFGTPIYLNEYSSNDLYMHVISRFHMIVLLCAMLTLFVSHVCLRQHPEATCEENLNYIKDTFLKVKVISMTKGIF